MRRIQQLVPFSRFHKRVLFVGESCKTDGARFNGYPTSVTGRTELLLELSTDLNTHFQTLSDCVELCDCSVDIIYVVREEQEKIQSLIEQLSLNHSTEEKLNHIGLLLVKHVRFMEREVFQKLQTICSEECLTEMFTKAAHAGIYNLHSL